MANNKCTEKERELIEALVEGNYSNELVIAVMSERIQKDLRKEFKTAFKAEFLAREKTNTARQRVFAQFPDNQKHAFSILNKIEEEALNEIALGE